ncbi:MAG TPA: hypothetical protein VM032_03265 [Vicinamibacterales bacterium]|nr:hypothetical protein [Vicinamibacterales bacterium]
MWTVDWDGDFVVGGDANQRLTPTFRLKEFRAADGTVRVHRELVSALQLLRDRLQRPLSVKQTEVGGLGAVISAEAASELGAAARAMQSRGVFTVADADANGLLVRIPIPSKLPRLGLDEALETAFSVTAAFETAGDKFQQITGNFDGAGLSFGPAQVNFGSGTLVPLFRKFQAADEAALRGCFADADDYDDFDRVMGRPIPEQVGWANSITTGRGGHDVADPWKGYFQAVGRVPRFREITVESILTDYGGKTARAIRALARLRPDITVDRLRCICALYDLVVQQGGLDKAWTAIERRVAAEKPATQVDLVRIAVEERGRAASPQWQADAVSRRVGILKGVPFTVEDRQRANIHFYMLRDVQVNDVDRLVSGNMDDELQRVRRAVATGASLLA